MPSPEPLPNKCGSPLRKKPGKYCTKSPMRGGATRCERHGGKNQIAPPGSPIRGGRPTKHGVYAQFLQKDLAALLQDVDVGDLEHEIRVAKVYLADAIRQQTKNPKAGTIISSKIDKTTGVKEVRFRPWMEVIDKLLDRVRRLELARSTMLAHADESKSKDALSKLLDKLDAEDDA